jgi:phage terminase Nu1 subunit (DNA packaging protein)
MENAKARREIAPIALLEAVLARTSRQIAGILEAIPVQIKRQAPELPPEVRDLIAAEINKARSLAANVELNLEDHDDGPVGDPESDPLRAAAA